MTTDATPRHLLAVNDSWDILDLYRVLLEREGYRVSLRVAPPLAEIKRVAPDLIVLDFAFGAEHLGLEVLQGLRMDRDTAATPVVVCSPALEAIRQMETHLLDQGTGLLLKPFAADDLLAEIDRAWARLAERRRAAGELPEPPDRVVAFRTRAQRPPI